MSEKRKDKAGRVLKTGESQRADSTYQYRYRDVHGKQRYVYAPTLDALRVKEAAIQRDLADGIDHSAGEITVLELVRRYIAQKEGMRQTTKNNYKFVVNLLEKEDFSAKRIKDVKQSDVKLWVVKLHKDGRKYSTIDAVRGVLKPAFNMAVEDDAIRKNPFAFALTEVIPNDAEERKPLTKEEQQRFLDFVLADTCRKRYYNEIVILLGTGLRVSELYGLTLSDIDFRSRRITVERQLQRTQHCEYYIEEPKTKKGIREIPMSEEVTEAFRAVIAQRATPRIEYIIGGHTGFLFLDKDEKPKVAGHLEHALSRIVSKYNATHSDKLKVTPHILRHTFCTNMVQAGMSPNALQYIMGHSDVALTLGTYTHFDFEAAKQAFEQAVSNL